MQARTLAVYDRLLGTLLERRFIEASCHTACVDAPRDNLDLRYLSLRF